MPKLRKRGPAPPPIWKVHVVEQRKISALEPYANNARRHDEKNLQRVKGSITVFGLVIPILIDRLRVKEDLKYETRS